MANRMKMAMGIMKTAGLGPDMVVVSVWAWMDDRVMCGDGVCTIVLLEGGNETAWADIMLIYRRDQGALT